MHMLKDTVFIKNLAATAIIGKDAWNRPSPQPIGVTLSLDTDFLASSETDNLKYSLNYAVISRAISEYLRDKEQHNFNSLKSVADSLVSVIKGATPVEVDYQARILIESKKSEIRADNVQFMCHRARSGDQVDSDVYKVNGLKLLTIIGVFTFERLQKQIVDLDLTIEVGSSGSGSGAGSLDLHKVIEDVVEYVENSNFKTVEALVTKVAQVIHQATDSVKVDVKVTKPNAIPYTDGVGVRSSLTSDEAKTMEPIDNAIHVVEAGEEVATPTASAFNLFTTEGDSKIDLTKTHTAYIAFGSNVGNQMENINLAVDLLSSNHDITVLATSSLYISKPMYVKDQADFYNGCLKVSLPASMTPQDLLVALKQIEYEELERVKKIHNGPRSIDLDIILYDDVVFNSSNLNVPHISMLERTFVLKPLCELIPPDMIHPVSTEPIHNHLRELLKSSSNEEHQETSDLLQIIPFPRDPHGTELSFDQTNFIATPTMIMGVLNITPDSFSDGGNNFYQLNDEEVCNRALQLLEDGATILDLGAVSTRPGSQEPEEPEELSRLLPAIRAIRKSSDSKLSQAIISIDTYRSNVAEQCLLAGADIINDISMGTLSDGAIFDVVSKYRCPYIINHTRGTPQTMTKLTTYNANENEDIVEYCIDPKIGQFKSELPASSQNLLNGICQELSVQMLKAFEAGVRKWQLIVDPGLGFAKNLPQNLVIIKNASFFKNYSTENHQTGNYLSFNGVATLLGPSRKKFLGTICKEEIPSERVISTGAAVTACIEQHTDIVRVHDIEHMKKVCLTADAIYKGIY